MPDKYPEIFTAFVPWLRLYLPWFAFQRDVSLSLSLSLPPLSLSREKQRPRRIAYRVGSSLRSAYTTDVDSFEVFVLMATCLSSIPLKPPQCSLNLINDAFALRRIYHYAYKWPAIEDGALEQAHVLPLNIRLTSCHAITYRTLTT